MSQIVSIRFGSHLYGTATAASDLDVKSVFVPDPMAILLQRAPQTLSRLRAKGHGEKNAPGEVDEESFALHRYLDMLAGGSLLALDMLFAPRWAMLCEPLPIWERIVTNRLRLVSRRSANFVAYCHTQANKYGIKGSRLHAVRAIVEWLDAAIAEHGHLAKVLEAAATLPGFIEERKLAHTSVVSIPHPSRAEPIAHLECCGRKVPDFFTLKEARSIFGRVLDNYGERARQAERHEGVDWKALSHAVRVGREALEFLAEAWITFPRPEAAHLLAIKRGELPYARVAEEIEGLLEQVKAAEASSQLPEEPDREFIDALVCGVYGAAVRRHYG